MSNTAIIAQLHHYIDVADGAKVEALYHSIEKEAGNEKYTTAELSEFYKRLEKYNSGQMPSYSVEEAHNYVRSHKKAK